MKRKSVVVLKTIDVYMNRSPSRFVQISVSLSLLLLVVYFFFFFFGTDLSAVLLDGVQIFQHGTCFAWNSLYRFIREFLKSTLFYQPEEAAGSVRLVVQIR